MFALALAASLVTGDPNLPGAGVSESLARERASSIADLVYDLSFVVPADRRAPIVGRASVRFTLRAPRRLVFDFDQPTESLRGLRIGGRPLVPAVVNGHIVVPSSETTAGPNVVEMEFVAGDGPLNRSDEFLYTLFVPARAQLAFPCFDQPDLKARYRLSLTVPDGWEAVSNAAARETTRAAGSLTTVFAETPPLPTYLFAFATGRFSVETATRDGRAMRMLHRETDQAKVARNREVVFDLHARSLVWLEEYTGIPYAFGKFDFVLIPSFQFGGMEHPGAILYNSASVLLDESATQNQMLGRASLIAHETAHMWFGDLVTMRWFNDVWMKEVFANLMAAKIVNPSFPEIDHDLRFFLAHYPAAYQVDRTSGTNPIRQALGNLRDAGQMYGPIIYEKAPIVMRQLELLIGESTFQEGLRDYLQRFRFGNATWLDLVRVLDARTPRDVASWSRAWVEERGRPTFEARLEVDSRSRVAELTVTQRSSLGHRLAWPQTLVVTLGDDVGVRHLPVSVTGRSTRVAAARGLEAPRFVLAAGRGLGYGLFLLDDASRDFLLAHIEQVADARTRAAGWVTLWDNLLEARVAPTVFFDAALRALPRETDEQNVQRVLGYAGRAFWQFLAAGERDRRAGPWEAMLRAGLAAAPTQSQKAAWFNAHRDTVTTPEGLAWLTRVWRRAERVEGLPLAEPDEIAIALELAVREVPQWDEILQMQIARTENADRRDRLVFVAPSLSADPATRERAFERFRNLDDRRREPWVIESLRYLSHPLRAEHAVGFIPSALGLLVEIQRTGDIFFPTRWMDAALWGHRSDRAAAIVRRFLGERPDYPVRLRWTIETAADELFRAAKVTAR